MVSRGRDLGDQHGQEARRSRAAAARPSTSLPTAHDSGLDRSSGRAYAPDCADSSLCGGAAGGFRRDHRQHADHDGRRCRARGRGRGRGSRARVGARASAARRRISPITSPPSPRDHTVVIFDHRGHGASDNPTDPAAYSLDRLRGRHARGRRRGRARALPAARPLDGRHGRAAASRSPRPARRRARDDGHVGRADSRLRPVADGHRVRCRAQRGQAGAQGAPRHGERPRDAGVQARARGAARLSRVRGRASGPICREIMWGDDRARARVPARRPRRR